MNYLSIVCLLSTCIFGCDAWFPSDETVKCDAHTHLAELDLSGMPREEVLVNVKAIGIYEGYASKPVPFIAKDDKAIVVCDGHMTAVHFEVY